MRAGDRPAQKANHFGGLVIFSSIYISIIHGILPTVFRCNFISFLSPLCIQITSLSAHSQGLITMCLLFILCYKFDFKNVYETIYLKLYAKYKHTQMCFVKSLNQYKNNTEEIKSSKCKWHTLLVFSQFLVHVPVQRVHRILTNGVACLNLDWHCKLKNLICLVFIRVCEFHEWIIALRE